MSRSNVPSTLLSDVENVVVFKLLADRVQSLSTAVVQLVTSSHLVTSSRGKATWNLVVTGVACFVKDWNRRGFFIQVNMKYFFEVIRTNNIAAKHGLSISKRFCTGPCKIIHSF